MFLGYSTRSQNAILLVLLLSLGLSVLGGCASDEERVSEFIDRGNEYVESDQHEEAIIEFKNVLQLEPENAAAHEALSIAYMKVDKPREAYWEMSETVRVDPDNVDARLRYASVSAAISDFDLAEEQAEAVLQLDPTNSSALVLRGQARESKEDFEAAERDYLAAVENTPDGATYKYILGGFYERRGDNAKAEAAVRDLVETEESYLAVSTLARMVAGGGDRDEDGQALLERAVELASALPVDREAYLEETELPETSMILNVPRENAIQSSHLILAAFHYERDRFDKAIEVLEAGVAASETKVELIYQMAGLYRRKGIIEKEDELIRRATTESPDSVSAQLVLSAYLGREGDFAGALEAARAAVAIEPKNRAAQLREAELLVDIGYRDQDAESIQAGRGIVDSVLEEEPESAEAHFVRAKVELAEGDVTAAKESLETVLQSRPDWAQARFVLGSALAASNELSRARVELARAIEIDPRLDPARRLLVKLHSQLGEHEFAIELGRQYLDSQPGDTEIRIIVGQSLIRIGRGEDAYREIEKVPEDQRDAAALFALGRIDVAFGRVELGAQRLREANELAPGNPQVLRALLELDRKADRLADSVARVSAAVEAHPDNSEIAELDAEIKMLGGDEAAARAALERAVELEPRNVSAQLSLAALEARAGNPDGMIAVMERAATAVPESSDLQYRLAVAYEGNGRRSEAIEAYEKAISLNADFAIAKNNLAYLLAESGGDLDRALELAQQAKEQLPDDGNSADTLGWVLLKRGVPSAAIGYLEEAVERFPESAAEIQGIVRNHLAEAYEMNSEAEKAVIESRRSVEFSDKLASAAKERGIEFDEPTWAQESRARIARLGAAS